MAVDPSAGLDGLDDEPCATGGVLRSSDDDVRLLPRRRLLMFTAVPAAVLFTDLLPKPAAALGAPAVSPVAGVREQARQNPPIKLTAKAHPVQDVSKIRFAVTNLESTAQTISVSYVDLKTGRGSRARIFHLGVGERAEGNLFGGLDRSFDVRACDGNGVCVVVQVTSR